jgi:hypothetical protein
MAKAAADIAPGHAIPRNRLVVGTSALVAWIATKIIGGALMAAPLPAQWTLLFGMLYVSVPKFLIVVAIVALGKEGFLAIRDRIAGGAAAVAPARAVGRGRYALGLLMFWLPLAKVWALPYMSIALPESTMALRRWDFLTDIVLMASFFVLGGDFWDKQRALFVRSARAILPAAPRAETPPKSATAHVVAAILLLAAGQVGFLAIRPAVMESGLGDSAKALLAAFFVLLPAIAVVAAARALGRAGSLAAHQRIAPVSVLRHRIGMTLIAVPLLGEIIIDAVIGAYAPFEGRLKVLLDLMLLGGVFALGPDFWDKLRALFDHRATVELAPQHQSQKVQQRGIAGC